MRDEWIRVTNETELGLALEGGADRILLADGDYGSLSMRKTGGTVLQSENPFGARFSSISLRDVEGVVFDGIEAQWFTANFGIKDLTLTHSRVFGQVSIRDATGVVIHDNDLGGSADAVISSQGLRLADIRDFQVTGNYIHHYAEDLMRVSGDSHGGVIEGNFLFDTVAAAGVHADLFQMFGANGKNPHDIVIRGNLAIDDVATGTNHAQGFFFTDPQGEGYRDILVEQNIVMSGATNTLTIRDATSNVPFLNNTLIGDPGGGGGIIRLGGDTSGLLVDGNLHKSWYVEGASGALILDNHAYGATDLTRVIRSEDRLDWQSYLPAAHSAAAFGSPYGAQALLEALLGAAQTSRPVPPAYELGEAMQLRGRVDANVGRIAQDAGLALDSGVIDLRFSASSVQGTRTVLSKAGEAEFAVYARDGVLFLKVDDGDLGRIVKLGRIEEGREHDLALSFDGIHVRAVLDGAAVTVESAFTLSASDRDLILGARDGEAGLTQAWLGRILEMSVSAPAPAPRVDGSLYHWMLAGGGAGDLGAFVRGPDGTLVDISLEARTFAATPVWAHTQDIRFNGGAGGQKVIAHDAAMEMSHGTISVDFRTSLVAHHRTVFSKESSGLGNDIEVWVKGGILYIELEDGHGVQRLGAPVAATSEYSLTIGFDGSHVGAWLNGQAIGTVASGFDLSRNAEALILGGGNAAGSGDVRPITAFHGNIRKLEFFAEVPQDDGTLPVTVRPVADMLAPDALPTPDFTHTDEIRFNGGSGGQVVIAHDAAMEMTAGILSVDFRTSLVERHRTLLSKESGDLGHDIEIWVKNGLLHVEVEDGTGVQRIQTEISAVSDHELRLAFDGKQVAVWLDEAEIGRIASGFDLSQNSEALILGGGNAGASGSALPVTAFHGTIYGMELYRMDDFLF